MRLAFGLPEVGFIFTLGIISCLIISWVFAISIATEIAKEKGHGELKGKFWFMGFFSGAILPCILAAALPDKKESKPNQSQKSPIFTNCCKKYCDLKPASWQKGKRGNRKERKTVATTQRPACAISSLSCWGLNLYLSSHRFTCVHVCSCLFMGVHGCSWVFTSNQNVLHKQSQKSPFK